MELKTEFNKTDIGVIPKDWDLKYFGEVFTFLNSASYSRALLTDDNQVQYVHYGDIHTKWNNFLDFRNNILPTIDDNKATGYALLKDGDLIMADASEDYAGVGKSVEIKGIGESKAISGLHTLLLRDKKNLFAPGFKGYLHENVLIKRQLDRLATGLKVFGISKNNLKSVQIPVPTYREQEVIATALTETDALIQSLEKLIAKKKAIKQGAMQELLKPKEDWKVFKLNQIATIIGGGTPNTQQPELWNGNINWFTPSEIGSTKYVDQSIRKISAKGLSESSAKMLPKGTILLTTRASIGDLAILECEASTNQGFQSLVISNDNDIEFIYYSLFLMKSIFLRNASGSTFLEISPNKIRQIEVSLPPFEKQCQISTILSNIDNQIQKLQNKLLKFRLLKQGMMEQLLTGKIRLIHN